MRRFLFAVILVVACATVAAADSYEDARSAIQRGDDALAVRLFRPLAEQGNAQAQFSLGLMYDSGQGVPQDFVRAHMRYTVAATRGEPSAAEARDALAKQMTPAQIVEAQRLAREWKQKGK